MGNTGGTHGGRVAFAVQVRRTETCSVMPFPTPGRSCTGWIPTCDNSALLPIPEFSRTWGVPIVPAVSITSFLEVKRVLADRFGHNVSDADASLVEVAYWVSLHLTRLPLF